MKRIKNLLAIVLCLAMVLSFSACSSASKDISTQEAKENIQKVFGDTDLITENTSESQEKVTQSEQSEQFEQSEQSEQSEQVVQSEQIVINEEPDISEDLALLRAQAIAELQNIDLSQYQETPYFPVHDNVPFFTEEEKTTKVFENYSELDSLGRCGVAYANICQELMPTDGEERGSISSVKPSGWQTNSKSNNREYDFVDAKWLYNRCHLIGWQLAAENANWKNLITATRYLNIEGMLPFENMVADAVREDNIHVLYRVEPIFSGDNLIANGVLMEGYSVEDGGETISFCIFCPNVQNGVTIDYATGQNY